MTIIYHIILRFYSVYIYIYIYIYTHISSYTPEYRETLFQPYILKQIHCIIVVFIVLYEHLLEL